MRSGGQATTLALALAMTAALLCAGGSVAAQPQGPCDEKQARDAFERAQEHYDQGRFRDAAELLEQALSLCADASLAYNLARSYEGMADIERAVAAYRRYLTLAPQASDRVAVERRIANLEALLEEPRAAARAPASAPSSAPTSKPPPLRGSSPSRPIVPWIVMGVGATAVGAGVVTGVIAQQRRDDAEAEPVQQRAVDGFEGAQNAATVANVLFVAGGVTAAVGLVWGLATLGPAAKKASLRLAVRPAAVELSGRY